MQVTKGRLGNLRRNLHQGVTDPKCGKNGVELLSFEKKVLLKSP
jgi:hypothetical protein